MNIVLLGFMGVGKTHVGRLLAQRLGLPFLDIDEELERRAGKSISDIFRERGEEGFRLLERKLLEEASTLDGWVISLGGGAVLHSEALERLRKRSLIILLTASPEAIHERVGDASSRPLLRGVSPLDRIRSLLRERWPLYLRAADLLVETTGLRPEEVAEELAETIGGCGRC